MTAPETKRRMGKCKRCGFFREITKDHVLPQLLWKLAEWAGVTPPFDKDDPKNLQEICGPCNWLKSARLESPEGLAFLTAIKEKMAEIEENGTYIPARYIRYLKLLSWPAVPIHKP